MDALDLIWQAWIDNRGDRMLDASGARVISANNLPHHQHCQSDSSLWAFATSGSSGRPRWIAHHREGLILSARVVNAHLEVHAHSHWGLLLPAWHVGGFGVLARAHAAGCRWSSWRQKWQARPCRDWLENQHITHSSMVPTQIHDLVQQHLEAPTCLQAIVVGGGHLDPACGQAARDLGWPVLASYGMTETASQIATQPLHARQQRFSDVALNILPHWQLRCTAEKRLLLSGPSLFAGEFLHTSDHAWRWQPRIDEWFTSQDRVELLPEQQLRVLGRSDFIIKILGELVDPLDVERQLIALGLPESHFAIIALPDARREHTLCLCFESTHVAPTLIHQAMRRYHQHCAGYQRVTHQLAATTLPRSELGKIRRHQLQTLQHHATPLQQRSTD